MKVDTNCDGTVDWVRKDIPVFGRRETLLQIFNVYKFIYYT